MLASGFEDPVSGSQQTFRALLTSLARPGTVAIVPTPFGIPAGLSPAGAAAVLTLLDFETTLWLGAGFAARGDVADFIRFQTGTRIVTGPSAAAFALIDAVAETFDIATFCQGDHAYPDRSTTVIVQVAAIVPGTGLRLTGPGIARAERLLFSPMPVDFLSQWSANRARFPRGIDLVLVSGRQVVALPRTVRITEGDA